MRETRTEIGSIDIELLLSWSVNVLAPGAINFYAACGKFLADTDW